jgi:hypothetical protein
MYVTPKYNYFDIKSKAQEVSLSCFTDDHKDITSQCEFKLHNVNPDITISNNSIKIGKKPVKSTNKIIVLYEKSGVIEQDFAMAYIE